MDEVEGKHLNYMDRRRQALAEIKEAWNLEHVVQDPGLREVYEDLPRAAVRLICCALGKDVNQGGILRLAEAFRLEAVDYEPPYGEPFDFTAASGVETWQPHRWIDPSAAIEQAKENGYTVYGLTLTPTAQAIQSVHWQFPCAVVLGEEQKGISDEVAALCDAHVGIPMYGMIPSLNVSTAAAIAVFEVIKAYCNVHPEFEPARNASRQLLNLTEVEYRSNL
ncbi:MAG: hypothetical protein KF784_07295 [Fimbriimonadaceae bacterium]|nr:hypothetical protein [Fimbriimonadaceae bacterium]